MTLFLKNILKRLVLFFVPLRGDLKLNKIPASFLYGSERGIPIDRFYIEDFLLKNKNCIKGVCLEVADNFYTKKFGSNVLQSEILDINLKNKKATIYGDIKNLKNVQDNTFDCIILTQFFQFIDDLNLALFEVYRILKPNGVVLATLPSFSRIDPTSGENGDFWRFTKASARFIFQKFFSDKKIFIDIYGNFFSGICFWTGLALEEVPKEKIQEKESDFPLLITVKAIK
jgi:SAM-dependent methyltransferase